MNNKYEPCSICEEYIEGVVCTQDKCPVAKMKVENDRLKKDNEYILMQHKFQRRPSGDCWNDVIEKAKAEAIEEFAERLKKTPFRFRVDHTTDCYKLPVSKMVLFIDDSDIDNIIKEMTEGEKC